MQTCSSPSQLASSQSPSSLFSNPLWKRFQGEGLQHLPILTLDREGDIQTLTRAARGLLEYSNEASIDECFFSLVHKRNMRRVMQDLANMVSRGKQRAQWLLRLRTGNDRWRWYRATVQNNLSGREDHIRIRLRPM